MEVKEVKPIQAAVAQESKPVKGSQLQRAAAVMIRVKAPEVQQQSVRVNIEHHQPNKEKQEVRGEANDVMNTVHLVEQSTDEIHKLVNSLDGIVQQAGKDGTPERRIQALEREANELAGKINEIAETSSRARAPRIENDEIRRKVEENIGKALDHILPPSKDKFDVGKITFSPRDSIINTIAKVTSIRQNIEELRDAVHGARQAIESVVSTMDVAAQNQAASDSSVRDVDSAVRLAGEARSSIFSQPEKAMESVGILNDRMLQLLKQ